MCPKPVVPPSNSRSSDTAMETGADVWKVVCVELCDSTLPPAVERPTACDSDGRSLAATLDGRDVLVGRVVDVVVAVEVELFTDFSQSELFSLAAGLSTKSKHVQRPRFRGSVVSTLTILNLFLKSCCWVDTGTSLKV